MKFYSIYRHSSTRILWHKLLSKAPSTTKKSALSKRFRANLLRQKTTTIIQNGAHFSRVADALLSYLATENKVPIPKTSIKLLLKKVYSCHKMPPLLFLILVFFSIYKKETYPNHHSNNDNRIDKIIPFPFIWPTKACWNQNRSNDIFGNIQH